MLLNSIFGFLIIPKRGIITFLIPCTIILKMWILRELKCMIREPILPFYSHILYILPSVTVISLTLSWPNMCHSKFLGHIDLELGLYGTKLKSAFSWSFKNLVNMQRISAWILHEMQRFIY